MAAALGEVTTLRQLRKTALSLPETDEHAGAFAVDGKEFATSTDGIVRLHLTADDVDAVLGQHPTAERLTRGQRPLGVSIPLADIDGQQLNHWVRRAWMHRAPRSLAAAAEAAERAEPGDGDLPRSIGRPATRALAAAGITTLDGVAHLSELELAALHGVGPRAVGILAEALRTRGAKT